MSPWLTLWIGLALTARRRARARRWITLRMSGHYLPLATIAWGLALFYLLGNLDFLGKYDGLLGIPALVVLRHRRSAPGRSFFYLLWIIVVLAALGDHAPARLARRPRDARASRAARRWPRRWASTPSASRSTAFVLAALLASVSGWLFAHFQRTVNPSPFGLNMGIEYLFMAVLGGVGYVWGALVGAGVVQILKDQLQVLLPQADGQRAATTRSSSSASCSC